MHFNGCAFLPKCHAGVDRSGVSNLHRDRGIHPVEALGRNLHFVGSRRNGARIVCTRGIRGQFNILSSGDVHDRNFGAADYSPGRVGYGANDAARTDGALGQHCDRQQQYNG